MSTSSNAELIASELALGVKQVQAAIDLLDEGATVPFISRYRKEATGGLTDTHLRDLEERLTYLRELQDRKKTILKSIQEQGKLDAALEAKITATRYWCTSRWFSTYFRVGRKVCRGSKNSS